MNFISRKLVITVLFFISLKVFSQTTFYDLNTIQKIEIFFSQPSWDYQMDTAKYGKEGYTFSDSVKINGTLIDSVGVKYKGNSSYDSTYVKNPLHLELDTYKNQSYQGIKDIKLGNGYSDPSMIREVLAYAILKNYMNCPRSNFAQVYINGKYIGLYSNDESINKQFLSNNFYSSNNTFIKCNPIVNPGPATKSNLKYISTDSSQYFNFYEIKSTYGWNDLVKLCDTVTNYASSVSSVIDVDRAIWMLAFNTILINLDSYSGAFCQNYYLYKDATLRYNPIIWDLNMAFGGFAFVGSGNSSLGTLTLANMQQLPLTIHSTDVYWPLIKNILSDAMFKRMYIAHAKTIVNEYFANNTYQTLATQLQTIVDTAVQSDLNKFYTYVQFQNGMTGNVTSGSFTIPGITNLMSSRVSYLQSTTDFTNTAPVITSVTPSNSSPSLNSTVDITANVTNTNTSSVYLGYRFSNAEKFTRILMYDDGAHNDGGAGDNVYGVSFTMQSLQAQYYIYAENNNAGMFSPERAEYEFYTLTASVAVTSAGQVVINEYLAVNQSKGFDETSQFEDWIEIYNTTSSTLDLYGLYLTDDASNLSKFSFPQNTVIQAHDYLIVWADDDPSAPNYLHANFKLSSGGEQLIISSITGSIIDSISFGAQIIDVSEGRCPNGTGPIITLTATSQGAPNCVTSVEEQNIMDFKVYPNPANSIVYINFTTINSKNDIRIYNYLGEEIFNKASFKQYESIDVSNLPNGVYLIKINNAYSKQLVVIKQ